MIIDNFMFFNELDLLEIRLNELCDVVDQFVLIESTRTHTSKKKRLIFDENKNLFSGFNIKHIIVDYFPDSDPWEMERNQRIAGLEYVKGLGLDTNDVVLFSDIDEIFKAESVKKYAKTEGWKIACADMYLFYYYMNCFKVNNAWFHPRWVKGDALESKVIRCSMPDISFDNCGWHFSFLGDIKEKLSAFAHTEFNQPPFNTDEYIEDRKENLKSLFDDVTEFVILENFEYLPVYVQKNMDRFSKYICKKKERAS